MQYSKNYKIPKPELEDTINITDIHDIVDKFDSLTKETEDNCSTIKTDEKARVANEEKRVQEESTRVSNENKRVADETNRVSDESIRKKNEETRESNELSRTNNESKRQLKESERLSSEEIRKTNEINRVEQEQYRKDNFKKMEDLFNSKAPGDMKKSVYDKDDDGIIDEAKHSISSDIANSVDYSNIKNMPDINNMFFDTFQLNLLNNGDFANADIFNISDWNKYTTGSSSISVNQAFDSDTSKNINSVVLQNVDSDVSINQSVEQFITTGIEYTLTVECSTESVSGSKIKLSFDGNEKTFDIPKIDKKIVSFTSFVNTSSISISLANIAPNTNLVIHNVMFTKAKYGTTFNKSFKDLLILNNQDNSKVKSVNGKIGEVILKAQDINMNSGTSLEQTVSDFNSKHEIYDKKLNNLGGRNYLLNSDFKNKEYKWSTFKDKINGNVTFNENSVTISNTSEQYCGIYQPIKDIGVNINKNYTISFYAKSNIDSSILCGWTSSGVSVNIKKSDEFIRYSINIGSPQSSESDVIILYNSKNESTCEITKVKVEVGYTATDWSISPDEIILNRDRINKLESSKSNRVTSVNGKTGEVDIGKYSIFKEFNKISTIVYVDAINGDDTNDGSKERPFKTLEKAIEVSKFNSIANQNTIDIEVMSNITGDIFINDFTGKIDFDGHELKGNISFLYSHAKLTKCNIYKCYFNNSDICFENCTFNICETDEEVGILGSHGNIRIVNCRFISKKAKTGKGCDLAGCFVSFSQCIFEDLEYAIWAYETVGTNHQPTFKNCKAEYFEYHATHIFKE